MESKLNNNNSKHIVNASSLLYAMAYILYMSKQILNLTTIFDGEVLNGLIFKLFIIVILVFSMILRKRYNTKWATFILIAFVTSAFAYIGSNVSNLFVLLLFIVASNGFDTSKLIKIALVLHLMVMLMCVFGCKVGVLENIMWISDSRYRYSLGYLYCTYISKVFLFCICYYVFLLKRKLTLLEVFVFGLINYILYSQTGARTTYYLLIIFLIAIYVLKFINEDIKSKKWTKLLYLVYPFCAIVSFYIQYRYIKAPSSMQWLNFLLTNRLKWGAEAISEYGISLWGNAIQWAGRVAASRDTNILYNYVDCSYLQIVLTYGVVFFIYIMVLCNLIMRYAIQCNNLTLIVILCMLAVHFMIEPQMIDLTYNVFLLLTAPAINDWLLSYKRRKWKLVIQNG